MIVWRVTTRDQNPGNKVVICQGKNREEAKRIARHELGGNPDTYIVDPLTGPEDKVVVKFSLNGQVFDRP